MKLSRFVGVFLLFILWTIPVQGQQEFFPFLAEITTDNVNVRAGQSENFERVGRLHAGDEVMVLDRNYSWYKIKLPSIAKSYISKGFVQIGEDGEAVVTASRLNVRAGPGTQHSTIGQVTAGTKINILEELEEWYRIEPFEDSVGWVAEDFIAFKSKDVARYRPDALKERAEADRPDQKKVAAVEAPPVPLSEDITVRGRLEEQLHGGSAELSHQLQVNGERAYLLQGVQPLLQTLENQTVDIKGRIDSSRSQHTSYPVLVIREIQLVL